MSASIELSSGLPCFPSSWQQSWYDMETSGGIALPCAFSICTEPSSYEVVSECGYRFIVCKGHAGAVERTFAASILEEKYVKCPGDAPCKEGRVHHLHPYGILLASLN